MYTFKSGSYAYTPEPNMEPPDDTPHVIASCGHEVYNGEELFEWEDGKTLCPDCMEDKFKEMSLIDRAELLGCEHRTISFGK